MGRELLVLPLNVDQDPHGFIGHYQAMNANIDTGVLARQIGAVLRTHGLTKRPMAEAVVDRLVHSDE